MCQPRWSPLLLPVLLLACSEGPTHPDGGAAGAGAPLQAAAQAQVFPATIMLPNGFQPEGITVGRGSTFFVGSLAGPYMGGVYRGDLRTGEGAVLVEPAPGQRQAVGLGYDSRSNNLYVAGGLLGVLSVYDADSGDMIASFSHPDAALANDLAITRDAVYVTDSFRPVLYRIALGPAGRLALGASVEEVALGGEFFFDPGVPFGLNTNGIAATPNGRHLIVANTGTGLLYRVDAATGHAVQIEVGASFPDADGIVLDGRTLYVVQNFLNQIAVIRLAPDYASGDLVRYITDERLRIPTTAALFGNSLYAVNARFDVVSPFDPTPPDILDIEFDVVRLAR